MQLVYTGSKTGTKFNVKDKTKKEHHHDLSYSVKCSKKNCLEPQWCNWIECGKTS